MSQQSADPRTIRISITLYNQLLKAYPSAFRHAYTAAMTQAFRDICLAAFRRSGFYGLPAVWAYTLFDWVKSVIHERANRETEMTRPKFIRLSGWGMVLAAVSFLIGLSVDSTSIRESLYRIAGPPVTREAFDVYVSISEGVGITFVLVGILLLLFGTAGLRMHHGNRISRAGRDSLSCSMISGGLSVFGILAYPFGEDAFLIFVLGLAMQFGFIAVFGLTTYRARPWPRWNSLPVFVGAWFPLFLAISMLVEMLSGGKWLELPWWVEMPMYMTTLACLALLGYLLQAKSGSQAPE